MTPSAVALACVLAGAAFGLSGRVRTALAMDDAAEVSSRWQTDRTASASSGVFEYATAGGDDRRVRRQPGRESSLIVESLLDCVWKVFPQDERVAVAAGTR